jgi:hypothetical protein
MMADRPVPLKLWECWRALSNTDFEVSVTIRINVMLDTLNRIQGV